jgi:PIN domain nuclease of toxin-antitoxin system
LTLLDTNAVLSLLWDEPGADEVADLLRGGDCALSPACLSEVVDKLIRGGGDSQASMTTKLLPLFDEVVAMPPIEAKIGWRAGELRAQHYRRAGDDLSQVDCLLLATAEAGDRIATSDGPLVRVARGMGIDVVVLPDSGGRRPDVD